MSLVKYICKKGGCDKSFQTISGREKHFKKCPLPDENLKGYSKMYDGKICSLKYNAKLSSLCNYYRHKIVHLPKSRKTKEKKEFWCNLCNKMFMKCSNLLRHMETHTRVSSFECQSCKKYFTRKTWYDKHLA